MCKGGGFFFFQRRKKGTYIIPMEQRRPTVGKSSEMQNWEISLLENKCC